MSATSLSQLGSGRARAYRSVWFLVGAVSMLLTFGSVMVAVLREVVATPDWGIARTSACRPLAQPVGEGVAAGGLWLTVSSHEADLDLGVRAVRNRSGKGRPGSRAGLISHATLGGADHPDNRLPLVLGVAGAIVGNAGRRARSGGGMAIAGMVLGLLATVACLAIYVIDGFIFGNHG